MTPEEKAEIEILADSTSDLRGQLMKIKYGSFPDEKQKSDAYLAYCTTTAMEWLKKFEAYLSSSAASSPSYATFLLFDLIDNHRTYCPPAAFSELMKANPKLAALEMSLPSRSKLAPYIASRRPA